MASSSSSDGVNLQVLGSGLSGATVRVSSLDATVGEVKQLLAQRLGVAATDGIKIICSGRALKEDSKTLAGYQVTTTSKLLIAYTRPEEINKLKTEAARATEEESAQQKLERLRHAAEALARDSAGQGARYGLVMEDQNGQSVSFMSEEERSALVTALSLHTHGQALMRREGQAAAAAPVLELALEAFNLCHSGYLDKIDNVGILYLDLVWCAFQVRDARKLASAREQLQLARQALTRAHGADMERMRAMQRGDFTPETALYLRLELLEGVSSYYSGEVEAALSKLQAASARCSKLDVSDEALAALGAMGFEAGLARRALRFCSGDMARAAAFALEQREAAFERAEQDRKREAQRKRERADRRKKAKTGAGGPSGAGSAAQAAYVPDDLAVATVASMGFEPSDVIAALQMTRGDQQGAIDALLTPGRVQEWILTQAQEEARAGAGAEAGTAGAGPSDQQPGNRAARVDDEGSESSEEEEKQGEDDHDREAEAEAEAELAEALYDTTASTTYDFDVVEERAAIQEFMALAIECVTGRAQRPNPAQG